MIIRIFNNVLVGLLVVLIIVVSLQVITRYLPIPFSWTEEISRFLLIWLTLLGVVRVLALDQHISLNFIYDRLHKKCQWILDFVNAFLLMCFLTVLEWRYIVHVLPIVLRQKAPVTRISMVWIYMAGFVASALMIGIAVKKMVDVIYKVLKERG